MVEESVTGDSVSHLCSELSLSTPVLLVAGVICLSCNDLSLVGMSQSVNVRSLVDEILPSVHILVRRVLKISPTLPLKDRVQVHNSTRVLDPY
jgi:hypothetical protein